MLLDDNEFTEITIKHVKHPLIHILDPFIPLTEKASRQLAKEALQFYLYKLVRDGKGSLFETKIRILLKEIDEGFLEFRESMNEIIKILNEKLKKENSKKKEKNNDVY